MNPSFNCIHDDTFLGSQLFYEYATNILTIIATPIHIYAGFCIIYHTPKVMQSTKWGLFNCHFWAASADLIMNFFVAPFVLLPALAAIKLGVVRYVYIPHWVQIPVFFGTLAMAATSILELFENRYHILTRCNINKKSYKKRLSLMVFNYFCAAFLAVPTTIDLPDQEYAKKVVYQMLPCLPPDYYPELLVVALNFSIPLISVFFVGASIFAQLSYYILKIAMFLKYETGNISVHTLVMQKKIFKTLCIQIFTPVVILVIPTLTVFYVIIAKYHNQAVNNITYLTISTHGLVSAIIMLLIHTPYRTATFSIFYRSHSTNAYASNIPIPMNTIQRSPRKLPFYYRINI